MNTAVIYARVSSREQEREGYSIPAQLKLLHEYARKHGLTVVREFIDIESAKNPGRTDGSVLRSGRETTQPNLTDLEYWAQGLMLVYLEGALQRALYPIHVTFKETEPPTYAGPAPRLEKQVIELPEPILDPYSVYQQGGSDLLREELTALSAEHQRQIGRAHALADDSVLDSMGKAELMALITRRVHAVSSARKTG